MFLLIIFSLPFLEVIWWLWADARLRRVPHAKGWRTALAAFVGLNLALYAWIVLTRIVRLDVSLPAAVLAVVYIWHLIVLPATVLCLAAYGLIRILVAGIGRLRRSSAVQLAPSAQPVPADDPSDPPGATSPTGPTRRQVLAAALVAVPPIATAAGQVRAWSELSKFRVRRLDVTLAGLPPALDGLTIAHVSDVHVGRFTNGKLLDDVVERTNAMRADLVLVTGDLIDFALADLDAGLDMVKRLESRYGLFMCEGNHDLFENRSEFEGRVRASGIPLLLSESATITIRGQRVQVLGLPWGRTGAGHGPFWIEEMKRVLPLRDPQAFTILLSHHPHAFDSAAAAGIPLTLSGHTHGGQLMLTRNIGAGPILFKYISGLYRQGSSALVVSNGVGNWFPLRINAPAEIGHLTLHAMA